MRIQIASVVLGATALVWLGSPSVSAAAATHTKHANGETGDTADISMFYDALKPYGAWYNTTLYGDVWHPTVADQKAGWRPYTNGNWGQTDQGWTWLSDEPFGWAVYHYGRWTQLKDTGWVWVPDSEWATAWVAWRSSPDLQMAEISAPEQVSYHDADSPAAPANAASSAAPADAAAGEPQPQPSGAATPAPDASEPPARSSAPPADSSAPAPAGAAVSVNYIGWAPLPPDAVVSADVNIGPSVDVSCSIDPADYCFVDAAEIGAPDLSLVIFPRERDYFYVGQTLNVTNIAYYGPGNRSIYVGGPDFARVRAISKQPIRTLQLDRQTGSRAVANSLRESHGAVVHGNTLQVAGPRFKSRPANGILGGDRPSLPKADSVKAPAPAGADPAAVANAHAAMARQAHATVTHAQAVQAVAASQAESKTAKRSTGSVASAPHAEAMEGTAERTSRTGSHTAAARGGEERSASARAEGEGRRHASTAASRAAHPQKPEGFMDQLKRQVSQAGRNVAQGGRPEARGAGAAKQGAERGPVKEEAQTVTKKK